MRTTRTARAASVRCLVGALGLFALPTLARGVQDAERPVPDRDRAGTAPEPVGAGVGTSQDSSPLVTYEQLGISQPLPEAQAVKVGASSYPVKVSVPWLQRHRSADVEKAFEHLVRAYPEPQRTSILKKAVEDFGRPAVVECRPEQDGGACSPTASPVVVAGVSHEGSPITFGSSGALFRGIFVFRDNVPWTNTAGGCSVRLRECVFVSDDEALYCAYGGGISSQNCRFQLGNRELQGKAEFQESGVRLLTSPPGAGER